MARLIALFDSYDAAHGAAQALIAAGVPVRVTYLLCEGDQGGDGMEGFYLDVTPAQRTPDGAQPDARVEPGAGVGTAEAAPFRELTTHRYAVTGTDSLSTSPSLPQRLGELGLSAGEVHRLLDRVAEGQVAAVFRLDGPGERPMAILAARGAREVQQVF